MGVGIWASANENIKSALKLQCSFKIDRVVIDTSKKYRRYSVSIPTSKVSSIPISILNQKSIDIDIDTSISILSTGAKRSENRLSGNRAVSERRRKLLA